MDEPELTTDVLHVAKVYPLGPAQPPIVLGGFATAAEARAEERRYWQWRAECARRFREDCERRQEQTRTEFVARVRARRAEARRRFETGIAADAVTLDRIVYWRREFPSLNGREREASRLLSRQREPRRRNVRTGSRRARAPASKADDDPDPPPDVTRLAVAAARLWAHVRRREARQRLAA